ncbi:hypothetical protein [Amphritea balenae]|uniref:Uncharacterized protein n=1 Tax=Amphritea balenae TaxID=452629 RepID=A0A3P1SRB4_9GAMM|nr:hypothetical protein [Amphritea balenae]RRC99706.1 hypothetical protein EHS89_09465 [Amphritea balenae]
MNTKPVHQNPNNRMSGSLVFFFAILIMPFLLIAGCSKEQPEEQQALHIDALNQSSIVQLIVTDYQQLSNQMLERYQSYKRINDIDGFILYRNSQWTPAYMEKKEQYQRLLHQQKAYIYRHQLDGLFDRFMNLQKLALHLKHSLQDSDPELERQAMKRFDEDKQAVALYL